MKVAFVTYVSLNNKLLQAVKLKNDGMMCIIGIKMEIPSATDGLTLTCRNTKHRNLS